MQQIERATSEASITDVWARQEIEAMMCLSALHGLEFVGLFNERTGYTSADNQKLIPREFDHNGRVDNSRQDYASCESVAEAWRKFDFNLKEYFVGKTRVIWAEAPTLNTVDGVGWTVFAKLVAWGPLQAKDTEGKA